VSKRHNRDVIELMLGQSAFPGIALHVPLALDLDGTLILSDLLFENFVAAFKKNPLVALYCAWWLLKGGVAMVKERLSDVAIPETDLIPANSKVVALAEAEAAAGRPVVLATAADRLLAARIAKRFPFISRVFASDHGVNLKGARKAEALKAAYPQGFIYAGDSAADIDVWRGARGAVTVDARPRVKAEVAKLGIPAVALSTQKSELRVFFKGARAMQWVKSALVFAPIPLAGRLLDPQAWLHVGLAFIAIGFLASATYLVNDLADLADDRRHWSKRNRALAAGLMPIASALRLIPAMAVIALALASLLGWGVFATVVAYGVTTLSYSLALKRVPLLDTLMLAGMFSLRLLLGVAAIGAVLSPWLFVFSMAIFLSISLAKRHTEVMRMQKQGKTEAAGRGYRAADEPLLLGLGAGAAIVATFVLCLYLMDDAARATHYHAPQFLWIAPMAIFLWLGRIWLLSQRGELDDDPVAFAVKDRVSIALGAATGLAFALAAIVTLPAGLS
jgi:4-hydroxybenzoate polyprenyltransferase